MYGDKSITLSPTQAETFKKMAEKLSAQRVRQIDKLEARRIKLDNERWNFLNIADKLY